MKLLRKSFAFLIALFLFSSLAVQGTASPPDPSEVKLKVTILEASNQGGDFDLDNDAYRDQLIKLFSYTAYHQIDTKLASLPRAERVRFDLPGEYQLILTYQGMDGGRTQVQAVIQKAGVSYVDTVLAAETPGTAFLGGPQTQDGVLVIILETGF